MNSSLGTLYQEALTHKRDHACGGVPYEYGELLAVLLAATKAQKILEVGTGIGYSTVWLSQGSDSVRVTTIDKDEDHLERAQKVIHQFGLVSRVAFHHGIAEEILPILDTHYDLIFYDGFVPQKKFVPMFYHLLRPGGLLISANLYLGAPTGGRYLTLLRDRQWITSTFADTALSVRR